MSILVSFRSSLKWNIRIGSGSVSVSSVVKTDEKYSLKCSQFSSMLSILLPKLSVSDRTFIFAFDLLRTYAKKDFESDLMFEASFCSNIRLAFLIALDALTLAALTAG